MSSNNPTYDTRLNRLRPTRQRARYVQLNNNLCNYPLARDARTIWSIADGRSADGHRYHSCKLPGDDRIEFRWDAPLRPAEIEQLRCPTAFDVNVLFLLLSEAQAKNSPTIEFASLAEMVTALDLNADTNNRTRLQNSLRYWQAVSIRFECWYDHEKKNKGTTKPLAAPIKVVNRQGRKITITLRRQWLALNAGYFSSLLLPLPNTAAAQNLVLAVATSAKRRNEIDDGDVGLALKPRNIRTFCRKIGINHSTRTRQLQRISTESVQKWYRRQGLSFVSKCAEGNIYFAIAGRKRAINKGTRAKPNLVQTQHQQQPKSKIERLRPTKTQRSAQSAQQRTAPERPIRVPALYEDGRRCTMWQLPNGRCVDVLPKAWKQRLGQS